MARGVSPCLSTSFDKGVKIMMYIAPSSPADASPPPVETREQEVEHLQAGYRYALALTHHREDAEDLVQQACLRVYRKYGDTYCRALLFTTIRNLFFDQCQRATRWHMVSLDEMEEEKTMEIRWPGPGLERLEVERLLAGLRAEEREALFLHYVLGHTAEEIGELTGQARNTVLSHFQRARKKLKKVLDST